MCKLLYIWTNNKHKATCTNIIIILLITAILPMFSKLVTAGVIMLFLFRSVFSFTNSLATNTSSSLKIYLLGRIFPPRSILTPSLCVFACSFLKEAPVCISNRSLTLHQVHVSGIWKGKKLSIQTGSSSICS